MKSQMKVRNKLIRVEWYDHCSYSGWVPYDEADDWSKENPILCVTVGLLWYEDSKNIIIVQTITQNNVSGLQKIIKSDIIHRKIIKV